MTDEDKWKKGICPKCGNHGKMAVLYEGNLICANCTCMKCGHKGRIM